VFRGQYYGKQAHQNDLDAVVSRARSIGVKKMMITGSSLQDSAGAIKVAEQFRTFHMFEKSLLLKLL
jgi:TatD DNase family protein